MALFAFSFLTFLLASPWQSTSAVPAGVRIVADMKEDLSSAKAKAGSTVRLVCMDNIRSESGTLFIPLGAELSGKVVVAQKHAKDQQARLSLRINRAKWDGGEAKLDAIVVTIVSVAQTKGIDTPSSDASRRDQSSGSPEKPDGEKKPGDQSQPPSGSPGQKTETTVSESWGIETVDDPAIGSAITADDADVVLTKGSRVVLKTR